jgi:cold shock CspA family protein
LPGILRVSQHRQPEATDGRWNREVVQRRQGLRLHHVRRRSKDLFVHHTAIAGSGFKSLAEGAKVEFEEEQGPKGPNAVNVRTI